MHPMQAQENGTITEPIANRAAIFIFDQNNSVTLHCLIDIDTCGDPVPEGIDDPTFVENLRGLADGGTFTRYGSISAWPSVTMPNHNTVGSGAYPGHHGFANNRFYERETKTLEAPIDPQDPRNPLYVGTSRYLVDSIETLHEAVHRSFGDWEPADGPTSDKAYTASVDEPSARGADYATLEPTDSFPNPADYIATQNPIGTRPRHHASVCGGVPRRLRLGEHARSPGPDAGAAACTKTRLSIRSPSTSSTTSR